MLCLNDELLFKLNLGYVSALVLQHTVIVLLLADSFRGQSQGARPSRTIVTLVGEDVILRSGGDLTWNQDLSMCGMKVKTFSGTKTRLTKEEHQCPLRN